MWKLTRRTAASQAGDEPEAAIQAKPDGTTMWSEGEAKRRKWRSLNVGSVPTSAFSAQAVITPLHRVLPTMC